MKRKRSLGTGFKKAFEVFHTEEMRSVHERVNEMARERAHQARIQGIKGNAGPAADRFSAYQSLCKSIGDDFVANMEKILIPNCGQISVQHIQSVTEELERIFLAQIEQAKLSEMRFAASIGRQKDAHSMILPIERLITSELSSYRQKVVSLINQSNLTKGGSAQKFVEKRSETDKLIFGLKNKRIVAISIVIALLLAGIASVTTNLREIVSFVNGIMGKPTMERMSDQDLETEVNPRFGFSFSYPKTWDRVDPANADGSSYFDPKEPRVSFSAWGGYAVVSRTLDDYVSFSLHERNAPWLQVNSGSRIWQAASRMG